MFIDATPAEIDATMQDAWKAFVQYSSMSVFQRASFMKAIASEIEDCSDELIKMAMQETNLPEARLRSEITRTVFQLNSYAEACERGDWLEARIDTAIPDKNPPKPDLRKMLVPIGPVVVFGSSNFPFAYSTAGGDTACAFAAGCPVVVKAHPAHAQTSELVNKAIHRAVISSNMPKGIFAHVHGASFEIGKALIMHPLTKAVAFTGSFSGGKQLFDWGNQREEPIPVFAEMGSINPVFLFPEKMQSDALSIAKLYAASITLGMGQFCTNPGLIIGIAGNDLNIFIEKLGNDIEKAEPAKMLHAGIAKAFMEKSKLALGQQHVKEVASSEQMGELYAQPTIATVTATDFLKNPVLHEEVFGPYSLIVQCSDINEMHEVAKHLKGQLTCSVVATEHELKANAALLSAIQQICGRCIMNAVPTGVDVCLSMHHGGPFPATTDARFTSVGADGIKRFARPIAFQNWTNSLLPDELKDENPLNIYRTMNNQLTKEPIQSNKI